MGFQFVTSFTWTIGAQLLCCFRAPTNYHEFIGLLAIEARLNLRWMLVLVLVLVISQSLSHWWIPFFWCLLIDCCQFCELISLLFLFQSMHLIHKSLCVTVHFVLCHFSSAMCFYSLVSKSTSINDVGSKRRNIMCQITCCREVQQILVSYTSTQNEQHSNIISPTGMWAYRQNVSCCVNQTELSR